MFANYEEALHWIHSRLRLGIKPGLKRMEWMMERLHHPERKIKAVHIGGTNGKGSTVTYLRCILQEAGYKVGTFTSPYIVEFNERISTNGVPISNADLVEIANAVKPLADELENSDLGGPTEFEVITAMSFYYFACVNKADIVLYEVGLGGRFDSTNILQPLLSIITSIGLDHTNILGETYGEIAFEKSGIIKGGIPVITGVKQEEALKVIEEQAEKKHAPIYRLGRHFSFKDHESLLFGESFTFFDENLKIEDLTLSMLGRHQIENASLAVMAALLLKEYFTIEEEQIRNGLKQAYWPGRFELISTSPIIVMDGAHNEEGIQSLVEELNKRYRDKSIKIIFAALSDKKLDNMIHRLDKVADEMTFVDFEYPRAAKAESLFEISTSKKKFFKSDWRQAIKEGVRSVTEDGMLVITGSLYFLSEAMPFVREHL
ncbi:bifunctional folylpolyglutamate synthase/dihydrofolate synthase [Bacillus dakarensis]|uniref:bifunctional folylpolyglutamate synthase/dihydrofolate synthase n=1 Tax=Robertmurraya dakarensis TaxID=1926278 RepID=UPI000980E8B4|nr:folylpolyglutamate synthase/dihydrofolate synthase family protein [Bacillus dakarensis]